MHSASDETFNLRMAEDCRCTENEMRRSVTVEEVKEHPEWMGRNGKGIVKHITNRGS